MGMVPVCPRQGQSIPRYSGKGKPCIITAALQAADEADVHGKNITPFLLAKVKELTGGESFETNVQLALNNARCAARIAAALCALNETE